MTLFRAVVAGAAAAAAGLGVLCGARAAAGDVVHLRNGSTIEGAVVERQDEVEVRVRFGSVTLRRSEVESIERAPTPLETYARRCAGTDLSDPRMAEELSAWCEKHDLPAQARALHALARDVALERRMATVPPEDAASLFEAALWAHDEGYDAAVQRYLLEKCLRADPDHADARRALGFVWYAGAWRSAAEAAKLRSEREGATAAAPRGTAGPGGPAEEARADALRRAVGEPREAPPLEAGARGAAAAEGRTIEPVEPLDRPRGRSAPVATARREVH
jgi:hypothetical protein